MKGKAIALLLILTISALFWAGCAADVFGEWVDAEGNVFNFDTGTVTATKYFGTDCRYVTKDGTIAVEVENPIFGGTMVMEGTYEIKGNTLTISFGEADSLNLTLTRY